MERGTDTPLLAKARRQASVQRRHPHLTVIPVKPESTVARLAEARCIRQKCIEDRL
jgi:hypothetical protein